MPAVRRRDGHGSEGWRLGEQGGTPRPAPGGSGWSGTGVRPGAPLSVLMPCRNAGPFLEEALDSVLAEPEVLELLVADGGSSDGSLERLRQRSASDPRLRLVSDHDAGVADALNRAFSRARGTVIGWLNADDRYLPGAPSRALAALAKHPEWLMVYGEGEHIDAHGSVLDRYPSRPAAVGLAGFRDYCFICQPTVFWRRSLQVMLGPFNTSLRTCFDFDYWLRAFSACPERIGQISALQAQTRRHDETISATQLPRAVLEATWLQARTFPEAGHHILQAYLDEISQVGQHEELIAIAADLPFRAEQRETIERLVRAALERIQPSGSRP